MTEDKELKLQFMLEEGLIVRNSTVEDLGAYDTSIIYKRIFFLRNPSKIYHALLIDPHFTNESWEVKGANMIAPLHTNKYLLTIPAEKMSKEADKNFANDIVTKSYDEFNPTIEATFQSRILWQAFEKGMEPNK